MDTPVCNQLIKVTKDQFQSVRKTYRATKESLSNDVDYLIGWFYQQPHLPKVDLDRHWVERVLIFNKCSLERTKERLDMNFASRNLLPHFFTSRDPKKAFTVCKNSMIVTMLPKMTRTNARVSMVKVVNKDSDQFDYLELIKFIFMLNEYRRHWDYCESDEYIMDMRGQTLGYIVKYHPGLMKQAEIALKKVYGHRILGIHLVYASPVLEKLITLLKMVLSEKLSKRIQVHQNLESLYKVIPKEILPKDYGGDEISTEEIFGNWENELCSEERIKWFKDLEEQKSDESKRPGAAITDDVLGIPGSFRKLVVD